ncbi:FHA domain-containing protein [Leifsonia sp. AG29]|uniref:FHA domain-containing protein n=1 Tax=Leifsonia sp. AG29 TaxID=2598860 RepID=UPI00131BB40F|nr:FHA domain-containing protein [Leifsonia sp. AG29]
MATTFVLDFSDGRRVETTGNGVIGRNPAAHTPGTELDDPAHVEFVTIADDAKSVSRAHLAFGQYDGVFWVMDLGSANGTSITYPGEGTFACDPKTRHEVDSGSVVRFGDQSFRLSRR